MHYNMTESLNLTGTYKTFKIYQAWGPDEKENFVVLLNVFVTNDYSTLFGAQNGFLGIAPCPKELSEYSFSS